MGRPLPLIFIGVFRPPTQSVEADADAAPSPSRIAGRFHTALLALVAPTLPVPEPAALSRLMLAAHHPVMNLGLRYEQHGKEEICYSPKCVGISW